MTKDGPRIVEIGARSGGYRQKMHLYAHGINMYQNHLALLHQQPLCLEPLRDEPCAVLELFPKKPGGFKKLQYIEELEELKSLRYLSIRAQPGDYVGKSGDGFKAVAVLMLHNQNANTLYADLEYVKKHVHVVTT